MKTTIAILLLSVTLTGVWAKVEQDTETLKRQGDEIANRNVSEYANGGVEERAELVQEPLKILIQVKENNKKTQGILGPLENLMLKIVTGSRFHVPRDWIIEKITGFLEGKRDNFSYYMLDAIAKWGQLRKDRTAGDEQETLAQLQDYCETARDKLDTIAQAFVTGLKELHDLAKARAELKELKVVAERIIRAGDANRPEMDAAVDSAIEILQKKTQQ